MPRRDHYAILGVSKDADTEAIKAAYRALARKLHPDVNKAPDAAARFAEVQEAYDVLSDPAKRGEYDNPNPFAAGAGRNAWTNVGAPRSGSIPFDPEDLGSMFEAMFGSPSARADEHIGGRAAGPRKRRAKAPAREVRSDLPVEFLTAALGGAASVRLGLDSGPKTLEVTIPPATEDGAVLRVRRAGGATGPDVLLTVRVGPHAHFRRVAGAPLDLELDLPLTIAEATLGARVLVPTLRGAVEMSVPAGVASGRRMRLRGQGLRDADGAVGDLYVVTQITPPGGSALSEEERNMLERVAARGPGPREGPFWPGLRGG